jgi:hypothetical protein
MFLRCYMRLYYRNIRHIRYVAKEMRQKTDDFMSLSSTFREAGGNREHR